MAKKKEAPVAQIKLQIIAGKANPSPPVGPALGQRGVNIMGFCKEFNDKTKDFEKDTPVPVIIYVYKDKSFTFDMKTPPASFFLKKAAGLASGSKEPGKAAPVGKVTKKQVREIAEKKMVDVNANDIEQACRIIEGTARSMGLEVVEG